MASSSTYSHPVDSVARRATETGLTHLSNGDLTRAEAEFRVAASRMPVHPLPHYNLGLLHKARREWREMFDSLSRAAGFVSTVDAALHQAVHWNLGTAATLVSDFDAANASWIKLGLPIDSSCGLFCAGPGNRCHVIDRELSDSGPWASVSPCVVAVHVPNGVELAIHDADSLGRRNGITMHSLLGHVHRSSYVAARLSGFGPHDDARLSAGLAARGCVLSRGVREHGPGDAAYVVGPSALLVEFCVEELRLEFPAIACDLDSSSRFDV